MQHSSDIELLSKFQREISRVVVGAEEQTKHLIATLLSGGHILIEDRPGTGKTTLAKAVAKALQADFKRVQMTPDLLPSDITGGMVFLPDLGTLEFRAGPIFTDLLLADELNRAAPRTQSALLEAMAEKQTSIDGKTYPLGEQFTVIATVNPVDSHGVQPLPEAELDRFLCSFSIGYPTLEDEVRLIEARQLKDPIDSVEQILDLNQLLKMRVAVREIPVDRELVHYVVRFLKESRKSEDLRLGASPRSGLGIIRFAQALAYLKGEDHLRPEDLQEALLPTLRHRIFLKEEGGSSEENEGWLLALMKRVPLPR